MKKTSTLIALALIAAQAKAEAAPKVKLAKDDKPCRVKHGRVTGKSERLSSVSLEEIPDTYIWNNINNVSYLTNIKN